MLRVERLTVSSSVLSSRIRGRSTRITTVQKRRKFCLYRFLASSRLLMTSSSEMRTMVPVLDRWDRIKLPRGPFTAAGHGPRQAAARDDGIAYVVPLFLQEGDLQPVGFVNPRILEALLQDCRDANVAGQPEPWTFLRAATDVSTTPEDSFKSIWAVCFADWVNAQGTACRTAEISRFVRRGCQQGLFKGGSETCRR
jgi:hypothetical protein